MYIQKKTSTNNTTNIYICYTYKKKTSTNNIYIYYTQESSIISKNTTQKRIHETKKNLQETINTFIVQKMLNNANKHYTWKTATSKNTYP